MQQLTLDQMVASTGRQNRRKKRSRDAPFHGQAACEGVIKKTGAKCANKAYYEQQGKYYCGVHSSTKKQRTKLVQDPQKDEKRRLELARWKVDVEEVAMVNQANGKKGHVRVGKLRMMRPPPHVSGYLKVFPNFRHGNRVDGFGCKTLSPMDLGPVRHGMLGWPDAENLENYYQGAKIFLGEVIVHDEGGYTSEEEAEVDRPIDLKYTILSDAIDLRKKMYKDTTPHRHKFKYLVMKNMVADKKNLNKPLFSSYYHQYIKHKERRFTYIESRYFYCAHYQDLAGYTDELRTLRYKIDQGYNLHILGYDGREVERLSAKESLRDCLYRYYLDESKPYGHELVLYTLLVISDPKDYPWNRYYGNHPGLYDGFID